VGVSLNELRLSDSPAQVDLETPLGLVGRVIIPPGLSAAGNSLEINFTQDPDSLDPSASTERGNTIFAIELLDGNGNAITQLDEPLTICLAADSLPGSNINQLCLSYYDEEAEIWICEDDTLIRGADNELCGTTSHLTNFALLLSGGGGSSGWDKTMGWLTLGFTAGALLLILASTIVLEVHIRRKQHYQKTYLRSLAQQSRVGSTL